ncbi:MAG: Na+/H+ antiporter NhaC family protein [Bacteroidetes bacterium]|nr:Na+/H+ antiporter NhaC family protein [Bacteroidota bacterium]
MRKFLTASAFLFSPLLLLAAPESTVEVSFGWLSVIPPLITIVLALIFREVIFSLLIGIFSGILILNWTSGGIQEAPGALLDIPILIRTALVDKDHISVILFTLMIGAMVSVISKNGGMMALVRHIAARANSARSAQLATWLLGIAIFFDDYANTLIVGKTMRPLMDRMKISREKLSYIVDSTAAPVASVAFITTWIGAEIGYINDGLDAITNGREIIGNAYTVFLMSLQHAFYPVLTLVFMFFLIWKNRDFGPMLLAERKAREQEVSDFAAEVGDVDEVPTGKEHARNALIPIFTLLLVAIGGIAFTGYLEHGWKPTLSVLKNISAIVGNADAYVALIWASFCGCLVAVLMTVGGKIFDIPKTVEYALDGIKLMLPAIAILTLAWTLSSITGELKTGKYLAQLVDGSISPYVLPSLVFILSGLIAFSTGTSWGTMSILYPIVLTTSWGLCMKSGLDHDSAIFIFTNVVSAVLAGAVLGDHCSPISDTTILSSLASDCDHISHVRTQLPYALTVGGVSVMLGTLPAGFGVPWFITFPMSMIALYLIVSYLGKMVSKA